MSRNVDLLNNIEAEFAFVNGFARPKRDASTKTARGDQRGPFRQELMLLAETMFLTDEANVPHQVVFCGMDASSGSSEICLGLGEILAAFGAGPVCLVDANRRSKLSTLLGCHQTGSCRGSQQQMCRELKPNLWLAAIGTDSLVEADSRQNEDRPIHRFREAIAEIARRFEFVLVDAPEANSRADIGMLAQSVGVAILVIEANSTRKAAALRVKKVLEENGVQLLGSVLNNRTFPIPEGLYRRL
jgi:receptor protein-tyrosine kinase